MYLIAGICRLVDAASDALQVLAERHRLVDKVDTKLAAGQTDSAHDSPEDIAIHIEPMGPSPGMPQTRATALEGEFEEARMQGKKAGEVVRALKQESKVEGNLT